MATVKLWMRYRHRIDREYLALGAAAFVVAAAAVAGAFAAREGWLSDYFRSDLGRFATRAFDREVWIANGGYRTDGSENPRGQMVDDLRANHLRPGLTRHHVLRLLGPPEERYGTTAAPEWGWVVGRYHNCTQQVLIVVFDRERRAARTELLMPPDVCD